MCDIFTCITGWRRRKCTVSWWSTFAYGEVATRPTPSAPRAAHGNSASTDVLRILRFSLGRSQHRDECSHDYGISMVWHGGRATCLQWTGDSPTRWSYGLERSFGYIWRSMVAARLLPMCCAPDTFNPLEVHHGSYSPGRRATNGMRVSCQQCRSDVWTKSRSV